MKRFFLVISIAVLSYVAGYYSGTSSWFDFSGDVYQPVENQIDTPRLADAAELFESSQTADKIPDSQPIDFTNLPVANPEAYSGLLEKLDKIPQAVIDSHLQKYFGAEQLEKISDSRVFAKRLLEVALGDEGNPSENVAHADIYFSKSPIYGKKMLTQSISVSKYEPLFAHIVTDKKLGDVIVKWQNLDSGELLLFKGMRINTNAQYISVVPRKGWSGSQYQVSLSSMDDSVILMAVNVYTVAQVSGTENPAGPNLEVIEDLISIGQAVPKVRE
jgi:hypothetical protein